MPSMTQTITLELPKWYDLHTHFRQGDIVPALIEDHLKMGCAGALAMPNTAPPVAKISETDDLPYTSLEAYTRDLKAAGADQFQDLIIPLYITRDTTPQMIEQGAKTGLLRACKYYPPHGTTGAQDGAPMEMFMENGVLSAMQDAGISLCIHGEEHGLAPENYFDRKENAEEIFYRDRMPKLVNKFPDLKIVGEHVTTKAAVDFISAASDKVAATITPQHLLYTIGHLLKGLKYHLYCLPLIKYDEDREALRAAILNPQNTKFFAGTDSAPHVQKMTPCGCAAGCYTGGIAPQLYAQAFEAAGAEFTNPDHVQAFKNFLCLNGVAFYDLPEAKDTFILEKTPQTIAPLTINDQTIIPLPLGMSDDPNAQSIEIPWSIKTS